ncbi:MAG: hypothetical protein ABRQ25_11235 [Clostridiaceae bacterium]
MKFKKNSGKKSKKIVSSIILYIASAVTAIAGIALLVNNVIMYNKNVASYVEQGYQKSTVTEQLIPGQLIPGVLEPIGLYLGIAFILLAAAIVNRKISNYIASVTEIKNEEPVLEVTSENVSENDGNSEEEISKEVQGTESTEAV